MMETTTLSSNNNVTIPSMNAMNVAEQLQVMRHQEETTYKCSDYFAESSRHAQHHQHRMTADSRRKMCTWCFEIVDYCKIFSHQTVDIAISYMDRFLSTQPAGFLHCERQFQLVAMTSLYMAIKLVEPVQVETTLLATLSRGQYEATEIADMEITILSALQWRVNGPTRLDFGLHFLALLPEPVRQNSVATDALLELMRLQMDLATSDYYFTTRRLSTAAMAAVLNAVEAVGLQGEYLESFVYALQQWSGVNVFSWQVQEARTRLLGQAAASSTTAVPVVSATVETTSKNVAVHSAGSLSPVCISQTGQAQAYYQQ